MRDDSPEARLDRVLRQQRRRKPGLWKGFAFAALFAAMVLFLFFGPQAERRHVTAQVIRTSVVSGGNRPQVPALVVRINGHDITVRASDPLLWKPPGETVCVVATRWPVLPVTRYGIDPDPFCR